MATPLRGLAEPAHAPAPAALRRSTAMFATRVMSLIVLQLLLLGVVYGVATAYRVFNDSFVAPIIFSPDNDLVIQNKLNLSRLLAERQRALTRIAESTAGLQLADRAVNQLLEYRRSVGKTLAWSQELTARQASVSAQQVEGLEQQRHVLESMMRDQEAYLEELNRNLAAGLIRKGEVERQASALDQLRLALLQNSRDRQRAQVELDTAAMVQDVLNKKQLDKGLVTPEMAAQRDQLARIELDLLKLQAEREAKLAQQRTDQEELNKIDELVVDMKRRPIFRAIEVSQNVAFVPYSQIESVQPGSDVYDCKLWSVFVCRAVGKVAELLPGEVVTQDPWGNPARGQYAILDLSDVSAAMSKALRVRRAGGDLVTAAEKVVRAEWKRAQDRVHYWSVTAAARIGELSTRR